MLCEGLLNTYFDYGIKAIIKMLEKPISFYYSEQIFELIEPYFDKINKTDINEICKCSIENGQVWPARMCARKYIPELLNMRENDIDRTTYIQLKYQIENQTWYRDD